MIEKYQDYERISMIAKEHRSLFDLYYDEFVGKIVRYEYGKGHEALHRGYYCPSLVEDIIVGGCKRGKISGKFSKNPDICYGYNEDGKIIFVEDKIGCEFIFYQDNIQKGIYFEKNENETVILVVLECSYRNDGKIESYNYYFLDRYSQQVMEAYHEDYEYKEDKLIVKQRICYESVNDPYIESKKYYFLINDQGCLASYIIKKIDENDNIIPGFWDDHVFLVPKCKQRKV